MCPSLGDSVRPKCKYNAEICCIKLKVVALELNGRH